MEAIVITNEGSVPKLFRTMVTNQMVTSAQCEACGNTFTTNRLLKGWGIALNALSARAMASFFVKRQIARRQIYQDYDFQRCPYCDYLQSWMSRGIRAKAWKVTWFALLAWFLLVALGIVAGLFGLVDSVAQFLTVTWQDAFYVLLAGLFLFAVLLALLVYVLFYWTHANRGHPHVWRTITPKVSFAANMPYAQREIGAAYAQDGDYEPALAHLNQAIKLYRHYAQPYADRGLIYLEQGDVTNALLDLNRYIELAGQMADSKILEIYAKTRRQHDREIK